jgi:mycoredoxin
MEVHSIPMNKIKIYGTSWCPQTLRAKQCLTRNEVPFDWCDIEDDKQGREFVEKVNRGNRSVPTIVFPDGTILVEPSDSELEKKLQKSK